MRFSECAFRVVACMLLLGSCSGGDGPIDPGDDEEPGGSSRMTATIDGRAWTAATTPGLVTALQFSPVTGGYIITGAEQTSTGTIGTSLVLTINNISGPGSYPLGVDGVSVYGGFASVTGTSGAWTTPISGEAGTITISALTATRIAGTFAFTARASSGTVTGTRTVTTGVFDAPILGNAIVPVLPDSVGAKMSTTLNGVAWNAAIVSAGTTATHLSLTGINERQTLVFTIPKPTIAGSYTLSNNPGSILLAWDPNAVAPAGSRCCYGIAGDIGNITFTSLTTTRAKGTFSAVLRAQPGTAATGQLSVVNGTFDVGLFHTP